MFQCLARCTPARAFGSCASVPPPAYQPAIKLSLTLLPVLVGAGGLVAVAVGGTGVLVGTAVGGTAVLVGLSVAVGEGSGVAGSGVGVDVGIWAGAIACAGVRVPCSSEWKPISLPGPRPC